MDWPGLLPELQNIIRNKGDRLDQAMLRLTCKSEAKIPRQDSFSRLFELFWDACGKGHLSVCQWIYETVKDSKMDCDDDDDDDDDDSNEPEPYTTLLLYDDALAKEQFHVAQWALEQKLPLRDGCANHLAINGKAAGLKWMAAQGLEIKVYGLHDVRGHALRQWLVETQHMIPDWSDLELAIRDLPACEEEVEYYLSPRFGLSVPDHVFLLALTYGRWEILDFLKKRVPLQYDKALATWPTLAELYHERPKVPWRHYIDVATKELISEDSD